jgi:hypothetical protein
MSNIIIHWDALCQLLAFVFFLIIAYIKGRIDENAIREKEDKNTSSISNHKQ